MSEGQMAREGRHRAVAGYGPNVPAGYRHTEVGVIPGDWDTRHLRTDISLLSGHHVMAQDCNSRGEGLPYLTGPADFPDGQIRHTKFTSKPTTICRAGDILVTVKGSGSGTLVEANAEYCISRQLMAIRPTAWNPTFLRYSLLQNASRIKAASTGLIPGLSRSDILDQPIPIPNRNDEQRAIATVLSDVDELIGSLEVLIAKKRDIKQAAMQQLLTGRTRLPGFGGEWKNRQLGELATMASGGTPLTSVPAYYAGDIPWVSISDMTNSGKVITNTERHLSHRGLANSAARLFPAYTVLYAMYASLGECSIAGKALCTSQAILGILPGQSLNSEFLYYYLTWIKKMVKELGQQGAQANLNKNMVLGYRLPIPPLPEQQAIATVLSDIDAEIAALEHRLDKTRAIKQGMMQQLLTGSIRLPIPDDDREDDAP